MIKLAIIGTGSHANKHFEAFNAIDGVKIVAICDVNEENLRQFGDTHGVATTYRSADDLFANEDFDAISNVTPDRFHKQHRSAGFGRWEACVFGKTVGRELCRRTRVGFSS